MMKSQLCLGLTCLSVGILACADDPELLEISSSQAALTASENTERVLRGVVDAADFLASSTSIAQTLSAFGGHDETCESSGAAFCPDGADCPPPETVCTSDEVSESVLEERRQEIRDDADELVRRLREEVLVEANLESETSTSATYRLGPEVLCPSDDEPDASPTGSGDAAAELDADCVDEVERLEPRLVLTSPREGDIDVTLLLGAQRHAPLKLSLYRQSLGVRIDLGEGLAVARELGEDLDAIHNLSGLLELRLVENAARDYSLELNVLEAVAAEVESDGDVLTTSLAASSPAWNVRLDGNANTFSAGFDLAAFRLKGPLHAFADAFSDSGGGDVTAPPPGVEFAPPEPTPQAPAPPADRTYTGVLDLFLAGLSGTVRYTADSDVLSIEDLGFGNSTSTLKHDGDDLLALDLNATGGRRVNLTFTPSDEGTLIAIEPSFDLRLALAFHYVADQIDGIADYLLDDTLRAWFDGENPSIEAKGGQLRVTSGTLHIESQAEPAANLSASAGMCLVGDAGSSDDSGGTGGTGSSDEQNGEAERHPLFSLQASSCE
jgi:hypothetical protein